MILLATSAAVSFVSGAVALGAVVVAVFFARFWRQTGDRFFALFALAFVVYAANGVVLLIERTRESEGVAAYAVRLASFVLILLAILDKNRIGGGRGSVHGSRNEKPR